MHTPLFPRSTKVLSEGTLQLLRERGEYLTVEDGICHIPKTSYMSQDAIDSSEFSQIEIPEEFESTKALEFLQFDYATAEAIWHKYLKRRQVEPHRADLFLTAREHVRIGLNAMNEEGDWWGSLRSMGMVPQFQERMMDEDFAVIRLGASCKEWILEMVDVRGAFLSTLDAMINRHLQGFGGEVSHFKDGILKSGPQIQDRRPSKLQTTATTSEESPNVLEGNTILYKWGALCRLQTVYNGDKLSFDEVMYTPEETFSSFGKGLYFYKDAEIARDYAYWMKNLVDDEIVPIGILKVTVPDHVFSSVKEIDGAEWKRYIWWHCSECTPHPHRDLEYLANFRWLVGPICQQSQILCSMMRDILFLDRSVWPDGEVALQYFTDHPDTLKLLETACIGKVWVTTLLWSFGSQLDFTGK